MAWPRPRPWLCAMEMSYMRHVPRIFIASAHSIYVGVSFAWAFRLDAIVINLGLRQDSELGMMASWREWQQPYRLSNLDLVTQSFLMSGNHTAMSSPK